MCVCVYIYIYIYIYISIYRFRLLCAAIFLFLCIMCEILPTSCRSLPPSTTHTATNSRGYEMRQVQVKTH